VTRLTEGARKLFGRESASAVGERVTALEDFLAAATGRLDEDHLAPARQLADRAQQRLRLTGDHTIVALAGATGSGKSSLFNRITGVDLAGVGVKRPTTSWALACAWGPQDASEVLAWIGIPERHQVARTSLLDVSAEDSDLQGLVLLDLPDHDSTEVAHHLEVDRLVQYADLLVWVLDPQKYADAAIHSRYLQPLATHGDVMLVLLNQIDRVPPADQEPTLHDVRRLLRADGLIDVPVLGTSAARGDGIDELKRMLAKRVRDKASATHRMSLDVTSAAERLRRINGDEAAPGVTGQRQDALEEALARSAGVPVVVDAVERSVRQRRKSATAWPPLRLLSKFRKDPLADLHLQGAEWRSSLPTPSPVQRSRVDTAVRELADGASHGLTQPWRASVTSAATRSLGDLSDALDRAIAGTDLRIPEKPWWVRAFGALQVLAMIVAVVGLGWMLGVIALELSGSIIPDPPRVEGLSLPLLLLVGGLLAGWVLAAIGSALAKSSATRAARAADHMLRQKISGVADERVLAPLETELAAYDDARQALARIVRR
jgi:GTPase Era involved in 16S rRNA processing